MFCYVAEVRDANPELPGFKDPVDLQQVIALSHYLPHVCYINMIRRGEDVASSTLKFNCGATNAVAGIVDWRDVLTRAYRDFDIIPQNRVLHLRLEDAQENLDGFIENLDNFIKLNINISYREELRSDLSQTFKPVKKYPLSGIQGFLVRKLAQNQNRKGGYDTVSIPVWLDKIYLLAALPYLFVDWVIRGLWVLKRKLHFR